MANYILSCTVHAFGPTQEQLDWYLTHKPGWTCARLSKMLWYVGTDEPPQAIIEQVSAVLTVRDTFALSAQSADWWKDVMFDQASLHQTVRANR
jgi:hypothetical protein